MATMTNKQKLVNQIFTALGRSVEHGEQEARPVLEQFIYAICRENSTTASADKAFQILRERFFDWNEIRVSSVEELCEVLEGLGGNLEDRAQRLIDFLQEVFETTFSFDLESLHKKGVKQAAKTLARFKGANDYVVSWVIQHSLGGHSIPLDSNSLRTLKRLGIIEDAETNLETVRASLEHQIPKAKGCHFVDIISELSESRCWEMDPACSECPLRSACPTGQHVKAAASPARKPR